MYVVTGGAGFIGSVLLREMNSRGIDNIIVVDHLNDSQKWRNLIKASFADYMDREIFIELVRSGKLPWIMDGIVHLGACSSTTETNSGFLMENNFHYSRDLFIYAQKNGIRFINASSAATYGAGEQGFCDSHEVVPRLRPLNMYAYSKQLFDLWLLRDERINYAASLKFFNVYGPNEYHKCSMRSVALKLFGEIGQSGTATLFASTVPGLADGEQKRDFIYVKDCANVICWMLLDKQDLCGIFNVGTGVANSFNNVAKAVFTAMNRPFNIRYVDMPETLARNYQSYTCAEMGWVEKYQYPHIFTTLEGGIEDYVRNYLVKSDSYV